MVQLLDLGEGERSVVDSDFIILNRPKPWRASLRSGLADAIEQKHGLGTLEVLIEDAVRKEAAKELGRALQQLYAEALLSGMAEAETVLVVADGISPP